MCRSEQLRGSQFRIKNVHRNDLAGSCQDCALNGVQSDSTQSNDDDAVTRSNLSRIDHGTHTCDHSAGKQGRLFQRYRLWNLDNLRLINNDILREGRCPYSLIDEISLFSMQADLRIKREVAITRFGCPCTQ